MSFSYGSRLHRLATVVADELQAIDDPDDIVVRCFFVLVQSLVKCFAAVEQEKGEIPLPPEIRELINNWSQFEGIWGSAFRNRSVAEPAELPETRRVRHAGGLAGDIIRPSILM